MTTVAGREAIQSRPTTPQLLISAMVISHTEGVNPVFEDISNLGHGIAQISAAVMQL